MRVTVQGARLVAAYVLLPAVLAVAAKVLGLAIVRQGLVLLAVKAAGG